MNKIFKVVWSKSKQCYVVVSEMAKNNSGKKRVLASVLAALAVVGAGATQVDAASFGAGGGNAAGEASVSIGGGYSGANTAANGKWAVAVGDNAHAINEGSIAMGYQATTSGDNSVAIGRNSKSNAAGAIAIGKDNSSNNIRAVAIGEQNTAQDADTIAMGYKNTAKTGGIAIGSGNTTDSTAGGGRAANNGQIAIGQGNKATNEDTIAIGRGTTASGSLATAIGRNADALGAGSIAFGSNGEPDSKGVAYRTISKGLGAVAIGMGAGADGKAAFALGGMSKAEADGATAISYGAKSLSTKSVAIGQDSIVSKQKTSSNYEFSGSHGTPSPAGYNTETITVNSGSAPATGAVAGNYYDAGSAVAIGNGATVSDESDRAVVVGAGAETRGNAHYSVVLGSGSHADASDGFVAGHGSYVKSRESIAIGSGANVSGTENIRSQAIGYGATVTGTGAYDATAIGATAQVSGVQGGVALGSGSLLSRTTNSNENSGWNSKYVNGTVVRNRAYTATVNALGDQWDHGAQIGAVSVGNADQKRQIINVAAGNQDTDAVNVAQLKNVGVRVGADTNTATIGTNKVAADFLAYNGQLNIKGDNNRVTTVSENDANGKDANVNVKFDYDGLVKAKTGSAVTVDQKTDAAGKTYFEIDAAAGSKTVVADGKNTTVTGAGTTASPYKVNVEGALTGISSITNNGGGKIEFTTGGTTISGGPVNVSNNKITGVANGDVSASSTDAVNGSQLHAVKAAERHIAPTTATHPAYIVDSNGTVTMDYVDGDGNATSEKALITGVAKNDLTNITNEGKKVITGLSSKVEAGDNVRVDIATDPTTNQKTYTVNAITPAVYTDKNGNKLTKDKDGKFHKPDGTEVAPADVITSIQDASGNVTGGNSIVNNVGSAIKNAGNAGDSFLTKLDAANNATPNAAVNVSDLKNTADSLTDKGLKFNANEGGLKTNKLGSTVTVQGSGALAAGKAYADEYNTDNIRTKIEQGADGNTTINVGLAKALKDINSVSNGSSSITLNSNPGGNIPAVSITGGNVDVGGNNITNLKSGGNTDSNAANIGDVKKIAKDSDLHIATTAGGTNNVAEYTVDSNNKVTLTYQDGNGTAQSGPKAVIDLSALANKITSGYTFSTNATENGGKVVNDMTTPAAETAVKNGGVVNYAAGKNLTVKQDIEKDASGAVTGKQTYTYALSDEIGIGEQGVPGKDGVDGKIGVNGKDGSAVVINGKDGSIGLNGKDGANGISIKGQDGANGVGINGKDGVTRIVYTEKVPDPTTPGTTKEVTHEVATLDDGMKYAGDDAQGTDKSKVIAKKLNQTLDIIGGADKDKLTDNNIGVNNDGNGKLKVQLSKEITGLTSVQIGGNTIKTDGDHITITAPDTTPGAAPGATTTTKVANLADEKHITQGTYKVGDTAIDANAKSDEVTMTYTDGTGNVVRDSSGKPILTKITGVANTDLSNLTTDGDKHIRTEAKKAVKVIDGKNTTVTKGVDGDADTYAVNVQGNLSNISSITNDGTNNGKISFGPNKTVTVDGDHNITLDAGNGHIGGLTNLTFDPTNITSGQAATEDQLKSVHDTLKASELHIAPTASNITGEHLGGTASGNTASGAAPQAYKYDATTKQVVLEYNDGTGANKTGTKAVIDLSNLPTGGDMSSFKVTSSAEDTTAGQEVGKHAGDTEKEIKNGKSVDFQAGKNMTVTQTNDGNGNTTINYALDKNLDVETVTVSGQNGKDGKIGLNGKDGTNGLNGTTRVDIQVEKGQDGIDGKNGADGISRIVYEDKTGKHTVATLDDGLKFTGNNESTTNNHKLGTLVKVKGEGVTEAQANTFASAAGNIAVVANGTDTLTLKLNKNLAGINKVSNGNSSITLNDAPGGATNTPAVTISGGNLSVDGNKITNVANGDVNSTSKDAVNGSQLYTVDQKFNNKINLGADGNTETTKLALDNAGGIKFNIKGDGSGASGANQYINTTASGTDIKVDLTQDAKNKLNKTITVSSGSSNVVVTPTTTGDNTDYKITVSGGAAASKWTAKTSAESTTVGKHAGDTSQEIADTKSVDFQAGKNMTVTQTNDGNGNTTINYALDKNLDVETVTVSGQNGKDGKIGLNGKDGTNGLNGTTRVDIQVEKGQDGIDGKNGADGISRIVYEDKTGKHTVATLDDGLKFTGNNESTTNNHKLGTLVKVKGEGVTEAQANTFASAAGNIAVVANGTDTLTIKLNKNLAGINKVSNGNSSITLNDAPGGATNTPAVTISGGNLSVDGNKITNVGPGTDGTDAVNLNQLNDVKAKERHIKPTTAGNEYTVDANGNVTMTYLDGNNNPVTGEEAVIKGIAKNDLSNITNEGKKVITGLSNKVVAGDNVTVDETEDARTKQKTYKVNAKLAELEDGTNTTVSGNGTAANPYHVNVAGDLKGITSIANTTGGPTMTIGGNSINITGGTLNLGDNKITNVANGDVNSTSKDAVNGSQLYTVDQKFNNKINLGADGNTETTKLALDNAGGIKFNIKGDGSGASGANQYINTTASGTDIKVDLTQDAKNKLNKTITVSSGSSNVVVTPTTTGDNTDYKITVSGGAAASKWTAKTSAESTTVGKHAGDTSQEIADTKSVDFQAGKNMTVTQTNDGNGNTTINYALDKNLDVETVTVSGQNGKDGKIGLNGKDGTNGLNGTTRVDIQVEKGQDGIDGKNGADGISRIVYEDKTGKHTVATLDDGLKFTGNNESTTNNHKLGTLVKVKGEGVTEAEANAFTSAAGNIAVVADGTDTLTVKLNKNLKGLNSIQIGGNTISSNGDNIQFKTNGGTTKTVATTDQLWTLQANSTDIPAKAGKVNIKAGNHISIDSNPTNGEMTINATGFGSMDGFKVKTSADADGTHAGTVSEETIQNGNSVDMQAGKNLTVTQTNDGHGNTTVNYALNKDVNLGNDGSLTTGNTTVKNNGVTITNTDPAKTVSLTNNGLNNGGNQITNVASGGNVDTNAANIGDIKRLAKDTRIKDGTYAVNSNGTVELTYVDNDGNPAKDASGNPLKATITGLTTLNSTRVNVAVNKTGSGEVVGSTAANKVTKGTEFVAGNNLIVERTTTPFGSASDLDNAVVYSLNSNLTRINSISNAPNGPKMTIGSDNVNFTGGDVKISNGNLDMNNNKITHVANGTDPNDAVNVSQLKAAKTVVKDDGGVTTRVTKSTGANGEDVYMVESLTGGGADLSNITHKVDQLGEEIGLVGAQGAALAALKPIQYDPLEPTQIMAGYGNYRGNSALALGVAHYKNESTMFHAGMSWAGGSSHMMANAGVTWKFGNRDAENAIADRYRKGPISAAYAMQNEMAAMKAQNAGLKSEVSDLKAENQQMKAQIAAMMAKLGL